MGEIMRNRYVVVLIIFIVVILVLDSSFFHTSFAANNTLLKLNTNIATLEDFDDILTQLDLGFNNFGGNMGVINDEYLLDPALFCSSPQTCALRLNWDFLSGGEIYTGYFFSLFGLTDTLTTFDGTITETLSFPEHTLDLDDIDGALIDPEGPRQFVNVCLNLTYDEADSVKLRLELNDTVGGVRFIRKSITGNADPQTICWNFRDEFITPSGVPNFDLHLAKLFTLVIEQRNIGDGVNNPLTGEIDIHDVWFTLGQSESMPVDDQELLNLMEKRAYQYFLDWSSRKPESHDIPQDRSTFGDLLTVGGIGFGIPGHIIGAERGWATRTDAATSVLNVLRILDDAAAFGPEPVGRIGYRGWFYHFLGVDGRRKLNFDFPQTPVDESLNTVELSSIDTGLALMGVLAAQSYFDSNDPAEIEIRNRAQSIYDRVEWDYMLESNRQQYYLGWKPNELFEGASFEIPDAEGLGNYAGTPGSPATLDYYTDEALILLLLGIGSETHPIPPETYHKLILDRDEEGLIRTYPGALFTYQFLHAFINTRDFPQCEPVWYNNSRHAMKNVIEYATENPSEYATYSSTAWGISANEGPFDSYGANGAANVAVNVQPEEDGSISYYAMISAASFGQDLRQEAINALRAGWDRGHWDPRFGLPDAFHDDISEILAPSNALRQTGRWEQRALFAIDQG
ncbi:MAG TPA: glucoamylase family protein, partial [Cyclobacteriaceae bacterium]|nr:glucoamylase family protein [Cyclobacteriaceae bacterium]